MSEEFGWLQWAERRHAALGLELDQLLEAHHRVLSIMGQEWRSREEKKATITEFHPLYRVLQSATDEALVEVCELAHYLQAFVEDPSLPTVLKDLRSAKYPSTLFELTMAYRWKAADAQVLLQPKTPRGFADFEATIHDLRFVIECSVFQDDFFSRPAFKLGPLIKDALRDSFLKQVPLAAKIEIKELAGDLQGDLKRVAKRLAREIEESADPGSATRRFECEGWSLQLEAITQYTEIPGPEATDWDLCFRISNVPLPPGQPMFTLVNQTEEHERLRVFVKLPADEQKRVDQIHKKFDREERQLRSVQVPRIMLFEVKALVRDALDLHDAEEIGSVLLKDMRTIPELACVFLVTKGWSTALRFKCHAMFIANPESIYQMPYSFIQKMMRFEQQWDFLTNRPFPRLSPAAAFTEYQRRSQPPQR